MEDVSYTQSWGSILDVKSYWDGGCTDELISLMSALLSRDGLMDGRDGRNHLPILEIPFDLPRR